MSLNISRLHKDVNSGYGTLQCYVGIGGCPGSAPGYGDAGYCDPEHIWSDTSVSPHYYTSRLDSGILGAPYLIVATYPFTVRCVLDVNISRIKYYAKKILMVASIHPQL